VVRKPQKAQKCVHWTALEARGFGRFTCALKKLALLRIYLKD
jgi:hypothetical protein